MALNMLSLKPIAPKWIAAGAVVFVFLAFDFAAPPPLTGLTDNWLVAAIGFGICIGQINLIATWAALGPGNIMVRLPWSILLSVLMWDSLVLGNRAINNSYSLSDAAFLGCILLVAIIAAQLPLWIARGVFQWRLVGSIAETSVDRKGPLQFCLWHLMVDIFLLSVALTSARIVLPSRDVVSLRLDNDSLVILPAVILCNLLITLPCIWGAFLRRTTIVPIVFVWLFYGAFLTAIEFDALVAMRGPLSRADSPWGFYLLNLTQCITVFGTLLIFRMVGFKLIQTPTTVTSCDPTYEVDPSRSQRSAFSGGTTRSDPLLDSLGFWGCVWLGTTAAGSIYGAAFAYFVPPPGFSGQEIGRIGLGVFVGGYAAGAYGTLAVVVVATLTWAIWLSRIRLLTAGVAGGMTGLVLTWPASSFSGFLPTVAAGLTGMCGGLFAGLWYNKRFSPPDKSLSRFNDQPGQCTRRDMLVRMSVLAVLAAGWTWRITSKRQTLLRAKREHRARQRNFRY